MKVFCKVLLLLFLAYWPADAIGECSDAEHPVTVQLGSPNFLRTWQPEGAHCRWWESRQSETNRFPAAVRSGPRWLVMQLRRPLMLDAVSVRGWDRSNQWGSAAAAGSPLSAFGASSLPVELLLEDPCHASWETFGSSDRWRKLGGTAAVQFILLNSSLSAGLSWSDIIATGRIPTLNLTMTNNSFCPRTDLSALPAGSRACFSVWSCRRGSIDCSFQLSNGSIVELKKLRAQYGQLAEFDIEGTFALHGATLTCIHNQSASRLEKTIGIVVPPSGVILSVTPVWVIGRSVEVNVTSAAAYPLPNYNCFIKRGDTDWNLNNYLTKSKTVVSRKIMNMQLASLESEFRIPVSAEMQNGTLKCSANGGGKDLGGHYFISQISEPCETVIDVTQITQRKVHVHSMKCSIWNVSHTCWLILTTKSRGNQISLTKQMQFSFSSTHILDEKANIELDEYLVRCSVNQSGLIYPDVEAKISHSVWISSEIRWIIITVLFCILMVSIVLLSCRLSRIVFKPPRRERAMQSLARRRAEAVTIPIRQHSQQTSLAVASENNHLGSDGSEIYGYISARNDPPVVNNDSQADSNDIYEQVRLVAPPFQSSNYQAEVRPHA